MFGLTCFVLCGNDCTLFAEGPSIHFIHRNPDLESKTEDR